MLYNKSEIARIAIIAILFVSLFYFPIVNGYASNTDIKYRPFIIGDSTWKSYNSANERKKALQIPDSLLSSMSTKVLLEFCLAYPYLPDIMLYDNHRDGLNGLISEFNGFKELLSRKDAIDTLLKEYQSIPQKAAHVFNSVSSIEVFTFPIQCLVLRYILNSDSIYCMLNENQMEKLHESAQEDKKMVLDYYTNFIGCGDIPFRFLDRQNVQNNYVTIDYGTYQRVSRLTPNWSPVLAWKLVTQDYTTEQKEYYKTYVESVYDGAQVIGDASVAYNCHSYAWHISEGGDSVWVGLFDICDEDIYWLDSSYVEVPENIATKVSYQNNHSAIRSNSFEYISKWGALPLVRHAPNNVPNYGSPIKFYSRLSQTITGSSNPFGTNIYNIQNLPEGFTVSWSFNRSSGATTGWTLQGNTPVANQCTFSYTTRVALSGTLTAELYRGGVLVRTIHKILEYTPMYMGTYYQNDTFHNTNPQNIPETAFYDGQHLTVIPKCNVYIDFDIPVGYGVYHSGDNLLEWTNNGQGSVVLRFPYSRTQWQYQTISGTYQNQSYEFYVDCRPDDSFIDEPILDLDYFGSDLTITLIKADVVESESSEKYLDSSDKAISGDNAWNLSIVNAITGRQVFWGRVNGESQRLSTVNWTKGIYVVKAQFDGQVLSQKIVIK